MLLLQFPCYCFAEANWGLCLKFTCGDSVRQVSGSSVIVALDFARWPTVKKTPITTWSGKK